MKHYRINKVKISGGEIVKRKDVLAPNDRAAVQTARRDDDCPISEVWHAGEKVGSIT